MLLILYIVIQLLNISVAVYTNESNSPFMIFKMQILGFAYLYISILKLQQ